MPQKPIDVVGADLVSARMKEMQSTKTICKRCLLQDLPGEEAEYYKSVLHYRKTLSPKLGVSDDIYDGRLAKCLECDELVNGICNQCGCYVQMRAAARKMHCPHPTGNRWRA